MRITKYFYSLALAPLLLGGFADTNIGQMTEELTVTALPRCAAEEFLVYRGGAVVCEKLAGSGPTTPSCQSSGQLLTDNQSGDPKALSCTPRGSIVLSIIDQSTISKLQATVNQLEAQVNPLGASPRIAARIYRGLSTVNTDARIVSGNLLGIRAADAICAAEFGEGASMCDVYTIYLNTATGKIPLTADLGPGWVYQAAWTAPFQQGGSEPEQGGADNCSGYTDNTDDTAWRGTVFRVQKPTGGTERVPKFYSNESCRNFQPISCCQ